MFIICDLYNKFSGTRFDSVVLSNFTKSYKSSNYYSVTLFSGMYSVNNIIVGIFDSDDYSIEYYSLKDLLVILSKGTICINGFYVEFFKKYLNSNKASLTNLDSIRSLKLVKEISNPSKDFLLGINKSKILGKEYINLNRQLISYDESFVKDNTFYIPNGVVSIEINFNSIRNFNLSFNKVYVPASFDTENIYELEKIALLLEKHSKTGFGTVILENDIKVTVNKLRFLNFNDIITKGKLTYSSLNRLFDYSVLSYNPKKAIVLSGSNKKIVIDLLNNSIEKVKL